MLKELTAALVMFVVCSFGSAHASLIVHNDGMVYDTDLNITWYTNPNYETHVYGDYAAWAAGLNVGGVTGWRLPTTPGTTTGITITNEGEMGHLFYDELKNPIVPDGVGGFVGRFDNKGPFTNLQMGFYTSKTHDGYRYYYFSFSSGQQALADINWYYSWIHGLAVHDGKIGSPQYPRRC